MRHKKVWIPIIAAIIVAVTSVVILMGNDSLPNSEIPIPDNSHPNEAPHNRNVSIRPGKVYVDNYVPGQSAQHYIEIYNPHNSNATFSVDFRIADSTLPGYTRVMSEARDWVWISHTRPVIAARQTFNVTIRLGMPPDLTPPAGQWEFWIGVIDLTQTGNVHVELCQRWLITMQ